MATTVETPSDTPTPAGQDRQRQMRQNLLYAVLGFIVLVFLLLVAFGGPKPPPVVPTMPSLVGKGLLIAQQTANGAGWDDVVAYDATGQARSLSDQRDWQVCLQVPKAEQADTEDVDPMVIDGREQRKPKEVWLAVVRTDEGCAKVATESPVPTDYGTIERVYDNTSSAGTNVVPNLTGYTPHMARLAFGEDASIRVTRIPPKDADGTARRPSRLEQLKDQLIGEKGIKSDDSDEVGGGWDSWQICSQNLPADSTWDGRVLELEVVRYNDSCTDPKMS